MCGGDWSGIDFSKVTSITMNKQRDAFLNKNYHNYAKSKEKITKKLNELNK